MRIVGGLREVGAISFRSNGYELEARSCDAPGCTALESRGSSQLILQRLAFGLYAMDQHGWKRCCCLFSAVGTDQSSAHDGTAIRWRARLAKLALFARGA